MTNPSLNSNKTKLADCPTPISLLDSGNIWFPFREAIRRAVGKSAFENRITFSTARSMVNVEPARWGVPLSLATRAGLACGVQSMGSALKLLHPPILVGRNDADTETQIFSHLQFWLEIYPKDRVLKGVTITLQMNP